MDQLSAERKATLCGQAKMVSENIFLSAILMTRVMLNSIIICILLCLIRYHRFFITLHKNAHILFTAHILWSIGQAAAYIAIHSFDFVRFMQKKTDPCEYLIPIYVAFAFRILGFIFIYGQIFSALSISIERMTAAIMYRTYENSASVKLAALLIIFQIIIATILPTLLLGIGNDWGDYSVLTTARTRENAGRYQIAIILELIPEVLTVLMFHLVFVVVNNRCRQTLVACEVINQADNRLSARYQLLEVKRALKLQIPMIWTHFGFFIVSISALTLYPLLKSSNDIVKHTIYVEIVNILPFYSFALPFAVLMTSPKRRQLWAKIRCKHVSESLHPSTQNSVGKDAERDIYFKQLTRDLTLPTALKGSRNSVSVKETQFAHNPTLLSRVDMKIRTFISNL